MRVTTQRKIGIIRTNTRGSSRSSLVWRCGTLSLQLCRRGHTSTHPVKVGVLVDLAKGTETNRIWARASAALSVEGRGSVELSRAILMVPGPFYPWDIGAASGIYVHRLPGLMNICTYQAVLAVQTQMESAKEQTGPGRGSKSVPTCCSVKTPRCLSPHQRVFLPSLCSLTQAPMILGLVWGRSGSYFPEISDGIFFSFCSYNYAAWSLRTGISGNCLSAEILWDSFY